jgi:hypothetical protein
MLKTELEEWKEATEKLAKEGVDLLYPKSYGDILVEDYNKVLSLLREIAGIAEPKEDD